MAYVDIDEFKTYLGVTTTSDDTLLGYLIARAKSIIDGYVNTSFDVSSDTTRYFTYGKSTDGRKLLFDMWMADVPTSVTNGDGTAIDSSKYVMLPSNGAPYFGILLKSSSDTYWTYDTSLEKAISVVGPWGWSASPPDEIVHAATRLTAFLYRQKDAQVFDQTAFTELGPIKMSTRIPSDVCDILNRYRWLGSYLE